MSRCMLLKHMCCKNGHAHFLSQHPSFGNFQFLISRLSTTDFLQKRSSSKLSRKLIRTPLRVYKPGDAIPDPGKSGTVKMSWPSTSDSKNKKSKFPKLTGEKTSSTTDSSVTLFSSLMGEIYITKSRNIIALEGARLVVEGLKAGLGLKGLFVAKSIDNEIPPVINDFITKSSTQCEDEDGSDKGDEEKNEVDTRGPYSFVKVHKIPSKLMQTWSSVTTPPGVIGVFNRPKVELKDFKCSIPVTVVCDNVREPGNLGAILRSAAGAGCKRVLLTKGCVDPWQSKVLRAGSGSHFCLPITTDIPTYCIGSYISLESHNDDIDKSEVTPHLDHQQEDRAPRRKDKNENPCAPDSTSTIGIFIADNNDSVSNSSISVQSYTDIDFNKYDNVYVVLGGETEGLSTETLSVAAYLSESYKPKAEVIRLRIPMQLNMESLNVAHAFAVIAFEILRQKQLNNSK